VPRQVEEAVRRVDAVVAVRIEERENDPGEPLEERRVRPGQEVPDQREQGLLPLDLPGVDPADRQDDGASEPVRRLGGRDPLRGEDEEREVPPSGLFPAISTARRGSARACRAPTNAMTSAWREVLWNPEDSARVAGERGFRFIGGSRDAGFATSGRVGDRIPRSARGP